MNYCSENDTLTSLHLTSLWSSFVRTGQPGGGWSPVEEDSRRLLSLGPAPSMVERGEDYNMRMEAWGAMYPY